MAGAVIASSTAPYSTALEFRVRSKQPNAVTIDLREAGVTSGANQDGALVARLPRQLDEIRVELPRLSPPGRYILGIAVGKHCSCTGICEHTERKWAVDTACDAGPLRSEARAVFSRRTPRY